MAQRHHNNEISTPFTYRRVSPEARPRTLQAEAEAEESNKNKRKTENENMRTSPAKIRREAKIKKPQ